MITFMMEIMDHALTAMMRSKYQHHPSSLSKVSKASPCLASHAVARKQSAYLYNLLGPSRAARAPFKPEHIILPNDS